MMVLPALASALVAAVFSAEPAAPAIDLDVCCVARLKSARSRPQSLLQLHRVRAAASRPRFRSVRTAAGLGEPGCDVFVVAGSAKGTGLLSAEALSRGSHSLLLRYEASPGMTPAAAFDRLWDLLTEVLAKGEPAYESVLAERPAKAAPAAPPDQKRRPTTPRLKDIDSQL